MRDPLDGAVVLQEADPLDGAVRDPLDDATPVAPSRLSKIGQFVTTAGESVARRSAAQGQNALDVLRAIVTPPAWRSQESPTPAIQPFPGANIVEKGFNVLRLTPPWAAAEAFIINPVAALSQASSEAVGTPPEQARTHGDLAATLSAILSGFAPTGTSNVARALQRAGIGQPGKAARTQQLQGAMQTAFPSKDFPEIPLTVGEQQAIKTDNPLADDLLRVLFQAGQQSGKKVKPDKVFKKLSNLPPPSEQVQAFDDAIARKQIGRMGGQSTEAPSLPQELLDVSAGKARAFLLPPSAEGTVPTAGEQALAGQDISALARRLELSLFTGQDGTRVLYRAKSVPRATLTALDKEGRLAEIVNGPGTSPKPVAPTTAVTARTPAGTEIRTVLTDTPETTASAVQAQPPGTQIEVKPFGEVGGVLQERMQGLRNTIEDARTSVPTGKQFYRNQTGEIIKTGNAGSLLERFQELFPELRVLPPGTTPKQLITAIDKDKGNTLYLKIQDAMKSLLAKEAANPEAVSSRPSDFDEFQKFSQAFDEVANAPTTEPPYIPAGVKPPTAAPQPPLLQTQAEFPPTPLQPKAPQVLHEDLLSGLKPQEPTRQAGLALGEEPAGTVELGMGLQIPKSIRGAVRRFFTGEEKLGATAHSGMNYKHLLNRALGIDPETRQGIGDLADKGYRSSLRHAGRHDIALERARLDRLTDAEGLNLIHVFKGRGRPMNAKVDQAFRALRPIDTLDADLMEKGGALVLRNAVYNTKTGARIREPQYKPFQRQQNYYHEVLDPRLVVKYDRDQLAQIIRNAPYQENRAIDAATAQEMAIALIARAKGEVVPSSVGDNAKRILRLGQPTASHLHERNTFWRIPDEILMRPKDAWPLYSQAVTRELGWLETLGPGYRRIEQAIMRARQSGRPDVEMGVQAWDRLRGGSVPNPLDTTINKWVQLGKSTATGTLLNTFTGIKQLSQGFRLLGSDVRWRHSLGTLRHAVSKIGQEQAKRMGAMVDDVKADMELMNPIHERLLPSDTALDKAVKVGSRVASAVVKASGVVKIDGIMRSWAAHAAKADFLAYQREAARGSRKAGTMLQRFGLTPQSSAQAVDEAAQAMSLKINYRADPLAIPGMFFHNTTMSLFSTLNKFNIGVVSDLRQNFLHPMGKAVAQKNWKEVGYQAKRIAKYLTMMNVGGEMIVDTILTLRGRPEDRPGGSLPEFLDDLANGRVQVTDEVVWRRFGENVVNAGTFGALSLVQNVLNSPGGAAEKAGRITGTVGGAAVGTAAEIGGHVANLLTADQTPGVRSKKSDLDRAKEAAVSSLSRRIPLVGVHIQDLLRSTGTLPGSTTSEARRAAEASSRAERRHDFPTALWWSRWYQQRHRNPIPQKTIKEAKEAAR